MSVAIPATALQLRSLIRRNGTLELSLAEVDVPRPGPDEVLVRIRATPINPSDLGLLLGPADLTTLNRSGTAERPVLTAQVPPAALPGLAARLEQSMPVGNEGAGEVVAAGSSAAAQALLGRTVGVIGGEMYGQYRCVPVAACLPLPEGTRARDGASSFVNPLTALGMIDTMRNEGHRALAHTAAASNLGQMLNRLCLEDGIELVNIVRKPEQAQLLTAQGARHVVLSSSPGFEAELTDAFAATGTTIAFDATGGGRLGGQLLSAMEAALNRQASGYSRYGSSTLKQVYLYGSLDTGPTQFVRNFGMAWSMGGWLLFPFLQKAGPARVEALKARVAAGLTTTFASHYSRTLTLAEVLDPALVEVYAQRATGEKFLIEP